MSFSAQVTRDWTLLVCPGTGFTQITLSLPSNTKFSILGYYTKLQYLPPIVKKGAESI